MNDDIFDKPSEAEIDKIHEVDLKEKMETFYIDYAMSVIASRALPDVRDGLKPVQRRVLYSMIELNNGPDKPHRKSARIVGDTMGKYHPHGDSSIYGALVNMAQDWSTRYPLVDGHGNFGSMDGDGAAAMRYTEARLSKISMELLADIGKNTVDFVPNFDDTEKEPVVLPSRYPNLLVNGTTGIAVGMATNIPPHNLREVVQAVVKIIDNRVEEDRDTTIDEILPIVKAPDFPTGGLILGTRGCEEAYRTGRGKIRVRAVTNIETLPNGKSQIIATELPYMVNKANLIIKIAELVKLKKIDGITDIRDESNREGVRVVIELRKDANANVILNQLYKHTQLQDTFGVIMLALINNQPKVMNLLDMLTYYLKHQEDVVTRRTKYDLNKAEERAHILEGLLKALDHIDEVIKIIRGSANVQAAKAQLMERFDLSDAQAQAIVDMRLGQLTGLDQDKLRNEYAEVEKMIAYYKEILADESVCMKVVKDELLEIKEKYGDERKTEIIYSSEEFNAEDFYADDEMIITISHMGYIKRTPLSEFRAQNRGGVGAKGSNTREEDFIEYIYPASMHNYMLFFTQKGKCYWLKVYEIPEGAKNSKGRAIQNMLNIESDDKVNAFIRVKKLQDPEYNMSHNLLFCTRKGVIKKTKLEAYSRPRQNGVNAITIREDDQVIQVRLTTGDSQIIIANKNGRAIRFHESAVREMGRNATGVKGMTLDNNGDEVVGMICVNDPEKETIMVVSEQGYGKRSLIEDYRITNRGGKGVKTLNITDKTGCLVAIKCVTDENDLVIINKSGITLRMKVADVRVMGRATQGVRLINLEKRNDEIASVCKVLSESVDENLQDDNVTEVAE